MSHLLKGAVAAALIAALVPAPAAARPLKRHKAHRYTYLPTGAHGPNAADPYAPNAADDPYNPYATPGAALRALARRNQAAPGVTNELAPDNIATATGGPSGGVPGFSGH